MNGRVLNIHWKDWCWSWNSNTLATWCEELTHLKGPWCWDNQIITMVWSLTSQFSSITQLCLIVAPWLQHSRPPCPSQLPECTQTHVHWVSDDIQPSSSVVPFSSCPQSFPALGSFQMSQLFASGGQRIGVSASASVLPMNIQDWSPLGWTGWISLQSKGLSRVFNTTVQKHQLFSAQLSL